MQFLFFEVDASVSPEAASIKMQRQSPWHALLTEVIPPPTLAWVRLDMYPGFWSGELPSKALETLNRYLFLA